MPYIMFAAAEGVTTATDIDVTGIMETAMTGVKSDMFGVLGMAVPIIVGIVGAVVVVKFGIKWVKSLGKAA